MRLADQEARKASGAVRRPISEGTEARRTEMLTCMGKIWWRYLENTKENRGRRNLGRNHVRERRWDRGYATRPETRRPRDTPNGMHDPVEEAAGVRLAFAYYRK